VAGGFLVALAAVGLFAAYAGAANQGRQRVAVARHDLAVGSRLKASDIELVAVQVPRASRTSLFTDPSRLDGRLVIGPVGKGELVQASSVLGRNRTPPFREVTLRVDAPQAQSIAEGDSVDVLVSTGTGQTARTEVVVGGVRVLRLADAARGLGSEGKQSVTFAVGSFDDARLLVAAAQAGSLTLVRSTGFAPQPGTFLPPDGGASNLGRR